MDGSRWSRGWKFVAHALAAFQQYPILVLPILIVWLVYAPSILYLQFHFRWNQHSTGDALLIVFAFIAAFSLMILVACDVLLQLIKQMEEGSPSLMRALSSTLRQDLASILPLALAWAVIWFALTLLDAVLFRRNEDDTGDPELDAQSAAEAIAGFDGSFSLNRTLLQALQKGIRMVVFLILPAIAWDNRTVAQATERGLAVLKTHLGEFARGYALTYAAAAVVFVPPAIIFTLGARHRQMEPLVQFPPSVWVATIIYCGLAWSFCLYLEQMFGAQLYLWHRKWEVKFEVAKATRRPLPAFKDIAPPTLLAKAPAFFS